MKNLKIYRKQIDKINKEILKLLAKRLSIVKKVGDYKKKEKIGVIDKKREQEIFDKLKKQAEKYNLSKDYIDEVFTIILRNSRMVQE